MKHGVAGSELDPVSTNHELVRRAVTNVVGECDLDAPSVEVNLVGDRWTGTVPGSLLFRLWLVRAQFCVTRIVCHYLFFSKWTGRHWLS
jgi:hypothetical protein